MKIATIVLDATGLIHCAATRAPDLYRRAVGTATGGPARLVHVALPPAHLAVEAWLEEALSPLAASRVAGALAPAEVEGVATRSYRATPEAIRERLEESLRPPRDRAALGRRLGRTLRRVRFGLMQRLGPRRPLARPAA